MKRKFLFATFLLFFPIICFADFKDTPRIPILEYHSVSEQESRWSRSYANFKNDLLWLYNNDYYMITAAQFARMDFRIPKGKKPIVITFDDGNENQFRLLENGEIDPVSAIGMMDEFYSNYPDAGRGATFYVNALPFGRKEHVAYKINYLLSTGREIGNHTLNHKDLSKLSADQMDYQLRALRDKMFEYAGFSFPIINAAYPHGGVPANKDIAKIYIDAGFLVGAEPALMPNDKSYDSFQVPRIQAIDEEWKRWFNRPNAAFIEKTEENFMPYIHGEEKHYPYKDCGDPDAEKYILQKKVGLSFSNLRSFFLSVFHVPRKIEPKAIYLNSGLVKSEEGRRLIDKLVESGGNAVVFDVVPAGRLVPWPGKKDLNEEYIAQIRDFIAYLDSKRVYKIARYVLFKNETLAAYRPEWLLKSKATGGIWNGDGGPIWLDASMPDVQKYMIDASKAIADIGVDEIQYDYVRFPTASNSKDTSYHAARIAGEIIPNKWMVIRDFLKNARDALMPYNVKLGVDLYGIVAWNDGYDAYSTGQKIECLAPYVDTIYPMIYPSHFGPGFGGWKNPADEPYHFVKKSSELFLGYMDGTYTALRPWLQGFAMRVSNYGSWYVPEQIRAINDLGINEFAIWNAANTYDLHWGAFKRG